MINKDILISDLNDISEILINNSYCGWAKSIQKAIDTLKEQDAEIEQLNRFVNGFSRDAIPVVRCKDCKHLSSPANGVPFCKHIKNFVDADWFCADGEREG